ncbi:MAG: PQQ-dependent sugar dehydrogenase [Nannocystaceae bacterium]
MRGREPLRTGAAIRAAALLAAVLGCAAAGCHEPAASTPRHGCADLPPLPGADRVRAVPRAPQIEAEGGVAIVQHPSDDERFYLVTKPGQILTWRGASPPTVVADLAPALFVAGEAGLLDLAFDPDFAENGAMYLSYNAPGGTAMLSRVSRFRSDDDGLTLRTDDELVVLEVDQPFTNHNGGDIGFGPDGMLYLGLGDGGSAGDPMAHAQDPDSLLGKILRVDVRAASVTQPYAIPADNPFAAGGGRPEIWALGFRNPWRWSFDVPTTTLWVGDVGQHRWEEVDRVERGGNYGWGLKEGSDCIGADTCDDPALVDPIAQYRNTGVASVVGGAVLRGGTVPAFEGSYVFSDFYDGSIFRVRAGEGGGAEVIGSTARGVAGWMLARDGTLLGANYFGGVVALVPGADADADADAFPKLLSQTGCVDMDDPAQLPEGVEPYDVNVAFWSDGARKQRGVAVPAGARAHADADGAIEWPPGTVLVKSFWQPAEDGSETLVETRLLARHGDAWVGYGYAWAPDGSDATLVPDEGVAPAGAQWQLPGLRGCRACHTDAAGGPLGTHLDQLARDDAGGGAQLMRLVDHGLLEPPPATTPLADPQGDAPLEQRARTYLSVNCSPCHREEGTGGRAALDLRLSQPLAQTGLCDPPRAGELDLDGALVITPGDPARSVLSQRLRATGDARMPPLGSVRIDEQGAALVDAWIESLATCP